MKDRWNTDDCAKAWDCTPNAARRSMQKVPGVKMIPVEGSNLMQRVVPAGSKRPKYETPGPKPKSRPK